MLDRRPARVTGRQVPPLHLRRGSGSGAIFKELPTNSADEAITVALGGCAGQAGDPVAVAFDGGGLGDVTDSGSQQSFVLLNLSKLD